MLTDSLGHIENNFERMKRELPIKIGNMGTRFFIQAFQKQGFTDTTEQAWQEPQRRIPGTPAYKYPKRNAARRHARAILVQSGKLRAAVNNALKSSVWDNIFWEVNLPYAAVHNYGLEMRYGKMPQRKFMGRSETFLRMVKEKIMSEMKKLHRK
jgi:phage gpG-like protein